MRARMFEFFMRSAYDEREMETLLETLESRGAIYHHKGGPVYKLYVPYDMDVRPFRKTILDCPSILRVGAIIHLTVYTDRGEQHAASF